MAAAIDRFCLSLGGGGRSGAGAGRLPVVIAGGLGLRIKDTILSSGFAESSAPRAALKA
jgi:glucokinase